MFQSLQVTLIMEKQISHIIIKYFCLTAEVGVETEDITEFGTISEIYNLLELQHSIQSEFRNRSYSEV